MPEPYGSFSSKVVPLPAENVDTDQIVPARYLKITDKAGLADVLFRDWRFDDQGCFKEPLFVLDRPGMAGRNILLAGANFGTGSSREHAPWALAAWGIKAVISTGYADIFRSNALKNGVLPISVDPETLAHLFGLLDDDPDAELTIDLTEQVILLPDGTTVDFDVDTFAKLMLLRGTDEIGYLVEQLPAIEAWEEARPARVDTRPEAAGQTGS
ncbi:MAG: 3-isopropylmalate dehydratase small subunit [Chloroflexi bacterium]|nr:3-isopropylmalate dehydratase small subunit [Chloroflexota bacterium]